MMKPSTPERPTKTIIIKTLEKLSALNQLATLLGMGRSWQLPSKWAHWCSPHWHECHGSVRKPQVVTQEAFRELRHPEKKHVPPVFLSHTPSNQRGRRGTEERPSSSRISSRPTVRSGAATARVFPERRRMMSSFSWRSAPCSCTFFTKYKIAPKSARFFSNRVDTRGNLVCLKVDTGWARGSSGYECKFGVSEAETIKFRGSEQRISHCESAVLTPVSDLGPRCAHVFPT